MDNVNNLNGIANFGHGEPIVPTEEVETSVDEVEETPETKVKHRAKVRSAAQKALGGKY